MGNYYDYMSEFFEHIPHGRDRVRGIRRAIDSAMEQQDIENVMYLYDDYFNECVFYDDEYEAVIAFPEFLSIADKYPEYRDKNIHNIVWYHKWIANYYVNFWQIPMAQIEAGLKNYSEFCDSYNYNKRTYYQAVIWTVFDIGRNERINGLTIEEAHRMMQKYNRDGMSDCLACERSMEIKYELFVEDNEEKALQLAQPLFMRRLTCKEVPDVTYARFSYYYIKKGRFKEAENYADKSWRLIDRKFGTTSSLANIKGLCMLTYAYTDTKKGLAVFKKTFPYCYDVRNGFSLVYYYYGAYHLMLQLEKEGKSYFNFNFPDKTVDFYSEKGRYYITDLKEYMYGKLKFLCDKFDERNGNNKYNDMLKVKYEPSQTEDNRKLLGFFK